MQDTNDLRNKIWGPAGNGGHIQQFLKELHAELDRKRRAVLSVLRQREDHSLVLFSYDNGDDTYTTLCGRIVSVGRKYVTVKVEVKKRPTLMTDLEKKLEYVQLRIDPLVIHSLVNGERINGINDYTRIEEIVCLG